MLINMRHIQLVNTNINIASIVVLNVKMPTFITFPVRQCLNSVDVQGEFKTIFIITSNYKEQFAKTLCQTQHHGMCMQEISCESTQIH